VKCGFEEILKVKTFFNQTQEEEKKKKIPREKNADPPMQEF